MRYLILLILPIFLCVNSYSQNTTFLPEANPGYLILNNKRTTVDSLMIREYTAEETDVLINQITKAGDEKKVFFTWKDVVESMKERQTIPKIIDHKCNKCRNNTVVVYFVSPMWTWENLCGRAGYLVICPHCIEQLDFSCTVMN